MSGAASEAETRLLWEKEARHLRQVIESARIQLAQKRPGYLSKVLEELVNAERGWQEPD